LNKNNKISLKRNFHDLFDMKNIVVFIKPDMNMEEMSNIPETTN
jgi:hypothetical protein